MRTYNIYSPYPEEFNRQGIGLTAKYHFVLTETFKNNLISEGKNPDNIYITGNTVIDALKTTVKEDYSHSELEWVGDSRLIILTTRRCEKFGEPVLLMSDTNERPEGIKVGTLKLLGTYEKEIYRKFKKY